MNSLPDLADRVERLVLRHDELKRVNRLLEAQVAALASERDSLKSRLAAARSRIDALLDRLSASSAAVPAAPTAGGGAGTGGETA